MSKKLDAVAVKAFLRERIEATLAWYSTGAVWCPETERNIKRDLDDILKETAERFGLRRIPNMFGVSCDSSGVVAIVWHKDWSLS